MSNIFARITKVDEETRTVYGRATQEVVDRDNEIMDYDTTKPHFMDWSSQISADTDGKSLGNVRSMHGNVAAGKLVDIQFDDHDKAIDVAAKIVDDNEWKKVLEGVHTGFSIGGRYIKKWPDVIGGKMVQRYTAVPSEISIVDRPCCPTAKFFEVHKKDGSIAQVAFREPQVKYALVDFDTLQKVHNPHKVKTKGGKVKVVDDDGHVYGTHNSEKDADKQVAALHAARENAGKTFTMPSGGTTGLQGYDLEGASTREQKVTTATAKRDYSDDARADMADNGQALPSGGFPIKTKKDVENAVQAFGRAKNKAKTKAHIIARAKAVGATDMLPADWPGSTAEGAKKMLRPLSEYTQEELGKFLRMHGADINEVLKENEQLEFKKGVYDVSTLSSIIPQLCGLAYCAERERAIEGDNSTVPEQLRSAAGELLDVLAAMATEEAEEIREGTTAGCAHGHRAAFAPGCWHVVPQRFIRVRKDSGHQPWVDSHERRSAP